MQWHDVNPAPGKNIVGKMISSSRWEAHQWARQTHFGKFHIASNMARGGFAATAFAATPGQAFKSAFAPKYAAGSSQHIQALEKMLAQSPGNEGITKALDSAYSKAESISKAGAKGRVKAFGGKMLGGGLMAGMMVGMPMYSTPGGVAEKGRAGVKGIAEWVGWEAGAVLGTALGGAAGVAAGGGAAGILLTGVGMIAGGLGASLLVGAAFEGVTHITDKLVDREQDRRRLNWKGDTAAFSTQKASTMRQQSLGAMNRGLTTARSAMGREGVMLHQ